MNDKDLTFKEIENTKLYTREIKLLSALEESVKSGSSSNTISQSRPLYTSLLDRWPCLEGLWIRWAHTEFRLDSVEAALQVFRTALDHVVSQRSVLIWTEYLRFKLRICDAAHTNHRKEFEKAASLVGSHFSSHEFWDSYLEICDNPVSSLVHILTEKTLHQFARFYAQLLEYLNTEHLYVFQEAMDLQSTLSIASLKSEISHDEAARMRAVIASKLQLRYELHSRRVNAIWPYEEKIVRPFYYPKPCPDVNTWLEYANVKADSELVYRRALIPCYTNNEVWLSSIRCRIRFGLDDNETRRLFEAAVRIGLIPLLLYYALWLELKGNTSYADTIYEKAKVMKGLTKDDCEVIRIQYSEFTDRTQKKIILSKIPVHAPKGDIHSVDVLDDETYDDDDL